MDGNSSWKEDSSIFRSQVSQSALSTSTDWNYIAQVTATTGEDLVDIPQWNIRVNGRRFSHYLGISKRMYDTKTYIAAIL